MFAILVHFSCGLCGVVQILCEMCSTTESVEQNVFEPGLPRRSPLLDLVRDHELSWRTTPSPDYRWMQQADLHDVVVSRLPHCLRKELVRYPQEDTCDKVFAAQWIDPETVCFGTKDNKLIAWNHATGDVRDVHLPSGACPGAPQPQRTGEPAVVATPPLSPTAGAATAGPSALPTVGIHDIDANCAGTLLVSGGRDDHDMALFALPSLQPRAVLRAHSDCVFASKFVGETTVLSGGRDGLLLLWDVSKAAAAPEGAAVPVLEPVQRVMRSFYRIRAIEHDAYRGTALVLGGDCSLMVFDCSTMRQVQRLALAEEPDLVALAVSSEYSVVATGSQCGTVLQDLRTGGMVAEVCDVGLPYGVRSLAFNGDVLAIGGGGGSVDFYDVRLLSRRLPRPVPCAQGSTRESPFFADFVPGEVPQAVYSLKYDPGYGSRLFVAGGPLLCGLSGSYASVWG